MAEVVGEEVAAEDGGDGQTVRVPARLFGRQSRPPCCPELRRTLMTPWLRSMSPAWSAWSSPRAAGIYLPRAPVIYV